MIINALNSGAKVFMADFEDSNARPGPTSSRPDQPARRGAPHDRASRTRDNGKHYKLNENSPRCWCVRAAGTSTSARAGRREPCSGEPVRLRALLLPQREDRCSSAAPARTSTCPSSRATSRRGCGTTCSCRPRTARHPRRLDQGTVLIETILAAFEMDEILYELRDHIRRAQLRPLGLHLQLHQDLRADPER
jgi:malate synthase